MNQCLVKNRITHSLDEVRRALDYDPASGVFVWRIRPSQRTYVGDVAGRVGPAGYRFITYLRQSAAAHRLAWFYVHGHWPLGELDHINGNRDDNRISNLREVSRAENVRNRHAAPKTSKTGLLGVRSRYGKYEARIVRDGKSRYLGMFDSAQEASAAYWRARQETQTTGG